MDEARESLDIEMQAVESSNVAEIGYHEGSKTIRVRFKNGGLYDYTGAERQDFEDLRDAPSVGRQLNVAIKGRFGCTKIG